MRRTLRAVASFLATPTVLLADVRASVDLLDPSDGGPQAPAGILVVDILMDVDPDDAWLVASIAASTVGSSAIIYSDTDPNDPLLNPGVADQFTTSISIPLPRFGTGRFENGRALIYGSDCPAFQSAFHRAAARRCDLG